MTDNIKTWSLRRIVHFPTNLVVYIFSNLSPKCCSSHDIHNNHLTSLHRSNLLSSIRLISKPILTYPVYNVTSQYTLVTRSRFRNVRFWHTDQTSLIDFNWIFDTSSLYKKNFNYLHIALIFSRQCDVYLFYQCLHLYIHLCMFIHETIYTINVRKTKMESFFFHRYVGWRIYTCLTRARMVCDGQR